MSGAFRKNKEELLNLRQSKTGYSALLIFMTRCASQWSYNTELLSLTRLEDMSEEEEEEDEEDEQDIVT
jgi:hypothetical protein